MTALADVSQKCSNFDALNHLVQHIGYSLIHNANFDIASIILEYLGLRISEGKNVYFARFVDLIFKYLCPNIVFENDSYLPVFQLNSRVFRDMIGTDNKLPEGVHMYLFFHRSGLFCKKECLLCMVLHKEL